jgi:hypothetical protein
MNTSLLKPEDPKGHMFWLSDFSELFKNVILGGVGKNTTVTNYNTAI